MFTPSSKRLNMSRQSSVKSNIFPAVFGQGREIHLRQGFLSKKCVHTWLGTDWVSKYVTLTTWGQLVYYPTLSAYLDSNSAKMINLQTVTIKIPGHNPTGVKCDIVDTEHNEENDKHEDEDKCFEIISLSQQKWVFKCPSPSEREEWVGLLKKEIKNCLQDSVDTDVTKEILDHKLANDECVDCGDTPPD